MSNLWTDLRYALRQLRKSPGFAALAIATLAIGIGASTAIYSIVDGVLLRSLPYSHPQQLISLFESLPALGISQTTFSVPDYTYVRSHAKSFRGMGAYREQDYELSGNGDSIRIHGERITASLFPVLGVTPELGRNFTEQEDSTGAAVVVLNHRFWRDHFASNTDVIGKTITLNRRPYTVIGVTKRSLVFPNHGELYNSTPAEIYVPMYFTPTELKDVGDEFDYSVLARLNPGVSVPQASAEIDGLVQQAYRLYPPAIRSNPLLKVSASAGLYNDQVVGGVRSRLILLQLSVLLVLLIACVDVANLMLARTIGRRREMALRIAVGAPRARIFSQLLSESLLLAFAGGLLALPLAYVAMHLLVRNAPIDLPRAGSISLSPGVLLFCFGVCLATALLTGVIPALRALHVDPNESLYEGGRTGTTGRGRHRILGMLVTAQFALAMVLLVTAGLLLRSFQQLTETNPGFRPDHVLTMSTTLPLAAYSTRSQIKSFYRELFDKASTLPGVRYAGLATSTPNYIDEQDTFTVEALPSRAPVSSNMLQTWVMGDYFRAMGIRLIRGRFFTPEDTDGSEPVVIVSQEFADRYFPGINPIGHRVKHGDMQTAVPWLTVVGVVSGVRSTGLGHMAAPETYTPYLQELGDFTQSGQNFFTDPNISELRHLYLAVRTQQDPATMQNLLVSTVHSIDPSLPVTDIHTMTQLVNAGVSPQRFNSFILGIFALIALLLASAGIGGVLAYNVRQRTREIGVRMALGAHRGDVSRLVLLEGLKLASSGVLLGAFISVLTAHWLESQLYEVSPSDPVTFIVGLAILFCIALIACWLPARRAASVDPMKALRSE
jgi:putative ABC transport system permease protein